MTAKKWEKERREARYVGIAGVLVLTMAWYVMLVGAVIGNFAGALFVLVSLSIGGFMIGYSLLPGNVGKMYEKETGRKW